MNRQTWPRRTWLAAVLTVIAVAAPCTAWYVVGSQSARREAEAMRSRPIERGQEVAMALAERLIGRLEAMRDGESHRPIYHFESSYHDPTTTCQCASRTPSPLATGPRDPFIALYFQIDPKGQLTVPILGDLEGVVPDPDRLQTAREQREALVSQVDALMQTARTTVEPASTRPRVASTLPWEDSEIESFQWHGHESIDAPLLVAMRLVGAAGAVQGFLLSSSAVEDWLRSADLPAVLRPLTDQGSSLEAIAPVPLDCTTWEIAVDVSEPLALASEGASRIEASFVRYFAIGSGAAFLAGASVLLLLINAERVARQRSRFAASAAHELRTPLTGLRLYGEMLSSSLDDADRTARYAQRIAEESERLSRVVTNVLGFAGLERGSVPVRLELGDLGATLRTIASRLELTVSGNGAELVVDIADSLPRANFDADAVDHIVVNLVDNAEKYSRGFEDRRVHLSARRDGDVVLVSVRDHGPGVSAERATRYLAPFERGEGADQPPGLGLGLALVDQLARAHGSAVRIERPVDGGARFVVSFGVG